MQYTFICVCPWVPFPILNGVFWLSACPMSWTEQSTFPLRNVIRVGYSKFALGSFIVDPAPNNCAFVLTFTPCFSLNRVAEISWSTDTHWPGEVIGLLFAQFCRPFPLYPRLVVFAYRQAAHAGFAAWTNRPGMIPYFAISYSLLNGMCPNLSWYDSSSFDREECLTSAWVSWWRLSTTPNPLKSTRVWSLFCCCIFASSSACLLDIGSPDLRDHCLRDRFRVSATSHRSSTSSWFISCTCLVVSVCLWISLILLKPEVE